MSQLSNKLAAAKPAAAKSQTGLAKWRSTNQRGAHAALPLLGRVWVELCGDAEVTRIESDVFKEMEALNLANTTLNALTYDACRTRLTLAWSVRDADDHEERFGTPEEWGEVDIDLLSSCGIVYSTVREQLDPIGMPTLTAEDCDQIRAALEKKSPKVLRSFGIAKLSLYLLSTDAPPLSSQTATSSSGESSPAT